jgi:hypothetical protein
MLLGARVFGSIFSYLEVWLEEEEEAEEEEEEEEEEGCHVRNCPQKKSFTIREFEARIRI